MSATLFSFRPVRTLIGRAAWLLIAAAHVPGLVHAWQGVLAGGLSSESIGGCLWLSLSTAFFGLKMIDVPWLRFRPGWRCRVAMVLVVALLHVDVIRPGSDPSVVPHGTAVLATALVIGGLPAIRRGWQQVLVHAEAACRRRLPAVASHETVWLSPSRPHCWATVLHLYHLRAPPL